MSVHQIWGRARRAVPADNVTDEDVEHFIERRSSEIDAAMQPVRRPVSQTARKAAVLVIGGCIAVMLFVSVALWLRWAP